MISLNNIVQIFKDKIAVMDGRTLKLYTNTLVMLFIRGASIIMSLISAPIMLRYVNRADYGVLLTLTSIVGWVGYMDIGLGNGLRNKLSEFLAVNDFYNAKKAVSSCYATLSIYVFLLMIIVLLITPHVDWLRLLNTPNSNLIEIQRLVNVIFVAFCFHFLFGLINSVLFAYQLPAYQSLFNFIGQTIAFIVLLIQVYLFDVKSVLQIGSANALIPPLV